MCSSLEGKSSTPMKVVLPTHINLTFTLFWSPGSPCTNLQVQRSCISITHEGEPRDEAREGMVCSQFSPLWTCGERNEGYRYMYMYMSTQLVHNKTRVTLVCTHINCKKSHNIDL